jgi:hypothetical protein
MKKNFILFQMLSHKKGAYKLHYDVKTVVRNVSARCFVSHSYDFGGLLYLGKNEKKNSSLFLL